MKLNSTIHKLSRFINNQHRIGYFFILPSLIILIAFVLIPLLFSFIASLTKLNLTLTDISFIGMDNYTRLFGDARFWNSLQNTAYFTVVVVPVQVVLSLAVAVGISKTNKYNVLLRSIFFLPVVCSMTIISLVFVFLLNNDLGAVAGYLRALGITPIDWLNDPKWAMPAVIVISIWKNFGFSMVIFLAALQGVSDDYYEASELDGAGKWRRFTSITIPVIMPTIGFVVITTLISSFQVFDQVFIMTNGGPLFKTETLVQYIYNLGFISNDMGYASANAVILFVIILIATMFMLRSMRRSESNF
jgi:multiple sugar transport system permease protein